MAKETFSLKKEITISATRAHLIGLIFLVPLFFLLAMPYYLIWSEQFTSAQIIGYIQAKEAWTFYDYGIIILVILIGIIAHEFLHGLGWSYFTRNGWKSIKFGVMWEMITPYCHCEEPLKMKPYRFGPTGLEPCCRLLCWVLFHLFLHWSLAASLLCYSDSSSPLQLEVIISCFGY
jgi:hypothetical protein